jgi:hypothetical protein
MRCGHRVAQKLFNKLLVQLQFRIMHQLLPLRHVGSHISAELIGCAAGVAGLIIMVRRSTLA